MNYRRRRRRTREEEGSGEEEQLEITVGTKDGAKREEAVGMS